MSWSHQYCTRDLTGQRKLWWMASQCHPLNQWTEHIAQRKQDDFLKNHVISQFCKENINEWILIKPQIISLLAKGRDRIDNRWTSWEAAPVEKLWRVSSAIAITMHTEDQPYLFLPILTRQKHLLHFHCFFSLWRAHQHNGNCYNINSNGSYSQVKSYTA